MIEGSEGGESSSRYCERYPPALCEALLDGNRFQPDPIKQWNLFFLKKCEKCKSKKQQKSQIQKQKKSKKCKKNMQKMQKKQQQKQKQRHKEHIKNKTSNLNLYLVSKANT